MQFKVYVPRWWLHRNRHQVIAMHRTKWKYGMLKREMENQRWRPSIWKCACLSFNGWYKISGSSNLSYLEEPEVWIQNSFPKPKMRIYKHFPDRRPLSVILQFVIVIFIRNKVQQANRRQNNKYRRLLWIVCIKRTTSTMFIYSLNEG